MKKIINIIVVSFIVFTLSNVAYALTLETNTEFEVNSMTFEVSGTVNELEVDSESFTVTVVSGDFIDIYSSDSYTYSYTANSDISFVCTTSNSRLSIEADSSNTFVFTPVASECTYDGGGGASGGGGGGGSVGDTPAETTPTETVEPTPTTDTPTTTTEDTTSSTPAEPATNAQGQVTLGQMTDDADTVASGDVSEVIAKMGATRDTTLETKYSSEIVSKVVSGVEGVTATVRNTVNNFVTYGTKSTNVLGAGERAGVVNSYKEAFGKLPTTTEEWNDVIKIANGRWPNERSQAKEDRASISFKSIYLREANMDDPNDNAAVTVMAYGLRPANRNLDSEKVAINTFRYVFGYSPTTASNWDAVRAIAYSGATR